MPDYKKTCCDMMLRLVYTICCQWVKNNQTNLIFGYNKFRKTLGYKSLYPIPRHMTIICGDVASKTFVKENTRRGKFAWRSMSS
jgi:hypothetical protein